MIRWGLRGLLLTIALVVLVTTVGWLLPVEHQATGTAVINASPEEVFARLREVERYPDWRQDVTHVEVLDVGDGLPRFREHGEFGPIIFRIVRADPPTFMQTRIDDPDQPFGGSWTYVLVPDAGGTRVTITENGEVYHPWFRFLSRFVFSQTATLDAYLDHLSRSFPSGRPEASLRRTFATY